MFSTSWAPVLVFLMIISLLRRQELLFTASVLVLVVTLAARWWGRLSLKGVLFEKCICPARTFPGEPARLVVTLENHKLLPVTWLQLEEDIPDGMGLRGGRVGGHHLPGRKRLLSFMSLGHYERVRREYEVRAMRRGYFAFGPGRLTCGDPFGFFKETLTLHDVSYLLVYPRIMTLQSLGLPAHRPLGDIRSADRLLEDPTFVSGSRDYDPSDGFRRIHWKASARVGRLQAKVYETREETGVAVFLNAATCDPPWSGLDPDVLDAVIDVAASVFCHCLEARHPTGMFSNGHVTGVGPFPRIPPGRSPGVLEEVLEALARVCGASESICGLLDSEIPALPAGCAVVLVTAVTGEGLKRAVEAAGMSGRPVTALLVGRHAELEPSRGVTVRRVHFDGGGWLGW
ncbi:MAG: DUF58 domain-containing protein [Firmicutes bacterium]|jgi:uncharacterized protein (DUF58 family)|nr:DUF58 domain-containing protein [Bacillota bacterium]